ncbi:MAG: amidohydrolase family protein, partial [Desulfobacterales bacterium]
MVRRLNIYRIATLMILFLLPGCVLIDKVGGDFSHDPDQIGKISAQAKQLINSAFAGIDPDSLRDYHVHIVGADRHGGNDDDTCGAGSFINEHFGNIFHLKKWIIGKVYMSGSGVTDLDSAYSQYVDRLDDLVKNFVYFRNGQPTNGSGKYYILALDCYYDKDGTPRPEKTTFYTPNNIVVELARKHRNKFIPVISVNPYNPNWRDELDKNGEEGVKFVKWLPNAQGIDACDPDIRPYYEKMKYWNMVLITHVGEEKAVEAVNGQKLGNPLRFRVP